MSNVSLKRTYLNKNSFSNDAYELIKFIAHLGERIMSIKVYIFIKQRIKHLANDSLLFNKMSFTWERILTLNKVSLPSDKYCI